MPVLNSSQRSAFLLAMRDMRLRGLPGVMSSVQRMRVRGMGVLSSLFMVPGRVVPSGFLVVLHRVLVMFGCLGMMALRRMMLVS